MRVLTEAGGTPEAITGNRYRVRVIEGPRWGSSGYYTSEAIDSAAAALSRGTKIFLDHPSASEDRDRPERSLRDLAARIDGPVTREADGVYAVMDVLPHWVPVVASLASAGDLDLSIRAIAEFHPGEAEGRAGVIVDKIIEYLSVDMVTEAGAGGRVLELIESARTPATETTARDRADHLRAALAAYQQGEDDYLWVRDHDETRGLVWFEQGDRIWQQPYTGTETGVTLDGPPVEVYATTTYHPVDAAGDTEEESTMPQIDEAEYQRLTEAANAKTKAEQDLADAVKRAEAAEAERDAATTQATEAAAAAVEAAIAGSALPDLAKDRVREAAKTNPGLDVTAAIKAEADYLAALTPTRPAEFGTTTAAESTTTKPSVSPWGRKIQEN